MPEPDAASDEAVFVALRLNNALPHTDRLRPSAADDRRDLRTDYLNNP